LTSIAEDNDFKEFEPHRRGVIFLASSGLKTLRSVGEARMRENLAIAFLLFGAAGQGTSTAPASAQI
jgi:hypothetical protein